jgi:serine/threonine protein phosphatase PrpC
MSLAIHLLRAINSGVTVFPEILFFVYFRNLKSFSDDFLIIACDGVWDEVSDEDAISVVRKSLHENNNDPYLVQSSLSFFRSPEPFYFFRLLSL